eukprot:Rhum_TRINITY_DN10620_c0_g1::Rhum_TRINITY_DN10620_c0_g1_i1::g.39353::m.39353
MGSLFWYRRFAASTVCFIAFLPILILTVMFCRKEGSEERGVAEGTSMEGGPGLAESGGGGEGGSRLAWLFGEDSFDAELQRSLRPSSAASASAGVVFIRVSAPWASGHSHNGSAAHAAWVRARRLLRATTATATTTAPPPPTYDVSVAASGGEAIARRLGVTTLPALVAVSVVADADAQSCARWQARFGHVSAPAVCAHDAGRTGLCLATLPFVGDHTSALAILDFARCAAGLECADALWVPATLAPTLSQATRGRYAVRAYNASRGEAATAAAAAALSEAKRAAAAEAPAAPLGGWWGDYVARAAASYTTYYRPDKHTEDEAVAFHAEELPEAAAGADTGEGDAAALAQYVARRESRRTLFVAEAAAAGAEEEGGRVEVVSVEGLLAGGEGDAAAAAATSAACLKALRATAAAASSEVGGLSGERRVEGFVRYPYSKLVYLSGYDVLGDAPDPGVVTALQGAARYFGGRAAASAGLTPLLAAWATPLTHLRHHERYFLGSRDAVWRHFGGGGVEDGAAAAAGAGTGEQQDSALPAEAAGIFPLLHLELRNPVTGAAKTYLARYAPPALPGEDAEEEEDEAGARGAVEVAANPCIAFVLSALAGGEPEFLKSAVAAAAAEEGDVAQQQQQQQQPSSAAAARTPKLPVLAVAAEEAAFVVERFVDGGDGGGAPRVPGRLADGVVPHADVVVLALLLPWCRRSQAVRAFLTEELPARVERAAALLHDGDGDGDGDSSVFLRLVRRRKLVVLHVDAERNALPARLTRLVHAFPSVLVLSREGAVEGAVQGGVRPYLRDLTLAALADFVGAASDDAAAAFAEADALAAAAAANAEAQRHTPGSLAHTLQESYRAATAPVAWTGGFSWVSVLFAVVVGVPFAGAAVLLLCVETWERVQAWRAAAATAAEPQPRRLRPSLQQRPAKASAGEDVAAAFGKKGWEDTQYEQRARGKQKVA